MSDDLTLLREYAKTNSEEAFATLVSRHINLVYSVAMRQVRHPHLAQEITQEVFIILARKAKSLGRKTILSGWLCCTARYVSADTLKTQRRRQIRERESQMQSILNESDSAPWEQIEPWLDEALSCLRKKEHDAVVLRFFEGKDLKQLGALLGMREDAARMRVNRGLEKLRAFFAKRGVTLSSAAIAEAVSSHAVQSAPTGMVAVITATAFSGTSMTAITTAAAFTAVKAIAMTTLQKTLVTATVAVLAGAVIYEARPFAPLHSQNQAASQRDKTGQQIAADISKERYRLKSTQVTDIESDVLKKTQVPVATQVYQPDLEPGSDATLRWIPQRYTNLITRVHQTNTKIGNRFLFLQQTADMSPGSPAPGEIPSVRAQLRALDRLRHKLRDLESLFSRGQLDESRMSNELDQLDRTIMGSLSDVMPR